MSDSQIGRPWPPGLEAAPLPNLVDIESLPDFAVPFAVFCRENAIQINVIAASISEIKEGSHWSLVDDMKGAMGEVAANESSDDCDEQEEALTEAESWVADELSCAGIHADVAMAMWLRGPEQGAAWLGKHKQQPTEYETQTP